MALPGFGGGGLGGGLSKTIATAGVRITPDVSGFEKSLTGQVNRIVNVAGAAAATAFAGFFAAGAGAAVAGAAQFASFESSLAKISGLVGVADDELANMEQTLLRLGPAVGKGPEELVDALFFITSAGLRGETALEALEAAAKASAAGLGETQVIADALTTAINAYGEENLNAEEATNALVGAVREGKLEAESLAGVVGRVVPLASAMGIEFNEVTAALAAMSRTGLDANEAATALRGIMSTLLKPTADAERLFQEFGTSIGDIRSTIRNEGLFQGLLDLKDVIGDNEDAFGEVIPNVRALSGFLNLLGENAEENQAIFQSLAGDTDFLGEAFGAASETGAFQFQQAMAELQTVLLEIGRDTLPAFVGILQTLLPVLRDQVVPAIKFAADLFVNFAVGVAEVVTFVLQLPDPLKQAAIAVGGLAAAFALFSFNPIVAGFAAVAGVIALIGKNARENQQEIDRFKEALERASTAEPGTDDAAAVLLEFADRLDESGVISKLEEYGVNVADLVGIIKEGRDPVRDFFREMLNSTEFTALQKNELRDLQDVVLDLARDYEKANEQLIENQDIQSLLAEGTDNLTRSQVELLTELGVLVPVWDNVRRQARLVTEEEKKQILAAQALGDENAELAGSTDDVVVAMEEEEAAIAALENDAIAAADAIRDLTSANQEALNPTLALFKALEDREDAEAAFSKLTPGAEGYEQALLALLEAEARVEGAQGSFALAFGDTEQAFFDLAEAVGVPKEAALALFESLLDEPLRNEQEILDAYGEIGEAIKDGVLSPIPSVAFEARRDLQAAMLGADFSTINIPGITLPIDVKLIPVFDTSEFDQPGFGDTIIPEGSNPAAGGSVTNVFNTEVNNPIPESAGETIEEVVTSPTVQRILNGRNFGAG